MKEGGMKVTQLATNLNEIGSDPGETKPTSRTSP